MIVIVCRTYVESEEIVVEMTPLPGESEEDTVARAARAGETHAGRVLWQSTDLGDTEYAAFLDHSNEEHAAYRLDASGNLYLIMPKEK